MRESTKLFVAAGLVVALALAFLVSPHASSNPDGLEMVAADTGIDAGVQDHTLAHSPVADYAVDGVGHRELSTGLAGVLGVFATFALGAGVFALIGMIRRRRTAPPAMAP